MAPSNNPQYVGTAVMLVEEQTLDNLYAFGWQLKELHDKFIVPEGDCDCDPDWWDQWVASLPDEGDDEEDEQY